MLERLAAFLEHHRSQNGTAPPRLAISDSEAVKLVGQTTPADHRFPDLIASAVKRLEAAIAAPIPADIDAAEGWFREKIAASSALWDALEGDVIHGVEVIRKRFAPVAPPAPEDNPATMTEAAAADASASAAAAAESAPATEAPQ